MAVAAGLASVGAAGSDMDPGNGPRWIIAAIGVVLLVGGVLLGRVFRIPHPPGSLLGWPARVRRALGAAIAAFGVILAIGAATDSLDHGGWETSFEKGVAQAKEAGGPVIIDCWADWCAACKTIFNETLQHPDVKPRLAEFTRIKLDMDLPENEALYDRFGFDNLPWVAVFDSVEALTAEDPKPRLVIHEAISAKDFLARLEGKVAAPESDVASWLAQRGLFVTLLLVFVGGILVSLTPCVLPVYILTVNVIGARRTASWKGRLGLSVVYVLGLALTYSVLGVLTGLGAASMGAAFQNPWVIGAIAGLFMVMALAYLEIFHLPQAGGLAARISGARLGNVGTAFLLGLAGGLIAAPCVGPMLVGILSYISTQQDVVLGFVLMFTFALGMGLLFIALGMSTTVLQKVRGVGAWGYRLEMLFALAFFAIGLYYLRGVIPALGGAVSWLAGMF